MMLPTSVTVNATWRIPRSQRVFRSGEGVGCASSFSSSIMEPSGADNFIMWSFHAAQMLHSIDEFTFLPKVSGYLQAHYIAPKVKALLHIMNHDTSVASCQYHPESPDFNFILAQDGRSAAPTCQVQISVTSLRWY